MMSKLRLTASRVTMVLAILGWGAGSHAAPPPAEAFGALPVESNIVLSPDGHYLAWIDHGDLTALLYAQGYKREEFVEG